MEPFENSEVFESWTTGKTQNDDSQKNSQHSATDDHRDNAQTLGMLFCGFFEYFSDFGFFLLPTHPPQRHAARTQTVNATQTSAVHQFDQGDQTMNTIDPVGAEMEKDFEGTLEKVAAIGYIEVEFAGYFDHTPQEVRTSLSRYGLTAPSTQIDYQSLESNWVEVVEKAQIIGHQYIINPNIEQSSFGDLDSWKRAADLFNRVSEYSKRAGIQLAYHNHFFEFTLLNGILPYELLLETCDPELLKMELDFCWLAVAKQDMRGYFERYPGRFPLAHVKQLKQLPVRVSEDQGIMDFFWKALLDITEVGEGVIDWKQTFAQSTLDGIQHYSVEQEFPQSLFESIQVSYKYLQELRF